MPIDWPKIRERMPMEKDAESKKKRKELFSGFDPNGNGYLSLAEVDKGVRDVLGLHELFDVKPVLMRAFQAAKSINNKKNKKDSHGPDFIEFCEFRLLLVYLRMYLEMYDMFDQVDTSDDGRVSKEEFKTALPLIESWGVKIEDPEESFNEIDTDGGGMLLFIEFANWAIEKGLDLEDDDE